MFRIMSNDFLFLFLFHIIEIFDLAAPKISVLCCLLLWFISISNVRDFSFRIWNLILLKTINPGTKFVFWQCLQWYVRVAQLLIDVVIVMIVTIVTQSANKFITLTKLRRFRVADLSILFIDTWAKRKKFIGKLLFW